jgi:hypothetical protein
VGELESLERRAALFDFPDPLERIEVNLETASCINLRDEEHIGHRCPPNCYVKRLN